MKDFLKKIPVLGWILRFLYNILRINNLKFSVYKHQEQLNNIQKQVYNIQNKLTEIQLEHASKIDAIQNQLTQNQVENALKIDAIQTNIESIVAKEIYYANLASQQRIDQFIFDSKILIKNNNLDIKSELLTDKR